MLSSWESPHSGCLMLEGLITQYLLGQESGYLRSFSLSPKPWRIPGERWSSVNNGSLEMLVLRSLKKSVRRIDKLGGAKGAKGRSSVPPFIWVSPGKCHSHLRWVLRIKTTPQLRLLNQVLLTVAS